MPDSILDNQMLKTALLVLAVAMIVYLLSVHIVPPKHIGHFDLEPYEAYEPFGGEMEPYDDDEGMEMFEDEDAEMFGDEEEDFEEGEAEEFDENEDEREFFDEEAEEFADDEDGEMFQDDDYLEEFDDEDPFAM